MTFTTKEATVKVLCQFSVKGVQFEAEMIVALFPKNSNGTCQIDSINVRGGDEKVPQFTAVGVLQEKFNNPVEMEKISAGIRDAVSSVIRG